MNSQGLAPRGASEKAQSDRHPTNGSAYSQFGDKETEGIIYMLDTARDILVGKVLWPLRLTTRTTRTTKIDILLLGYRRTNGCWLFPRRNVALCANISETLFDSRRIMELHPQHRSVQLEKDEVP